MSLFGPPNVENLLLKKDVKGLIKALGYQKDYWIRRSAARVLGVLGYQIRVDPLIKALGDTVEEVREKVAWALGKLGDSQAVEPLIRALGDAHYDVRTASLEALGNLGDIRAVEPLIKALDDFQGDVREAFAKALGKFQDKRVIELLMKALGDTKWHVREGAVVALGKLADIHALEPLIKILGDVEYYVRLTAANSLIEIGLKKPELIGNRWDTVKNEIEKHIEKHNDFDIHEDFCSRYTGCTHGDRWHDDSFTHTDKGIDLQFPEKPKNLDF